MSLTDLHYARERIKDQERDLLRLKRGMKQIRDLTRSINSSTYQKVGRECYDIATDTLNACEKP